MFLKRPLFQMLLATAILGIALWFAVHWFLGGTDEFSSSLDVRSLGYLREESQTSSSSADDSGAASDTSAPLDTVANEAEPLPDIQRHEAVLKEQQNSLEEATEEYDSDGSSSLSDEELEARAEARRRRLAELGLIQEKPLEPTTAVDVSLLMPEKCKGAVIARVPIGLKYRYESSIIRGESLNALESLVALYRLCEQGDFVVTENPLGFEDATPALTQMRFDEVKYFFIQHSISIDAVQFPEEE